MICKTDSVVFATWTLCRRLPKRRLRCLHLLHHQLALVHSLFVLAVVRGPPHAILKDLDRSLYLHVSRLAVIVHVFLDVLVLELDVVVGWLQIIQLSKQWIVDLTRALGRRLHIC